MKETIDPQGKGHARRGQATGLGLLVACGLFGLATPSWSLHQEPPAKPEDDKAAAETPEPGFEKPAQRKAIAGLGSVAGLSKMTFPSQPDLVYQLESIYVFPDRARWRIAPFQPALEQGQRQKKSETLKARRSRRLQFRFGTGVWTIEPTKTGSRAYTGEEVAKTLLQLELRRVAMIWPAELEWKVDGTSQRAPLKDLGHLVAEMHPETQRPVRIKSMGANGEVFEELTNIKWTKEEKTERYWPASWDLHAAGKRVWSEEFLSVRGGLKYNDAFFVPFDRRESGIVSVTATSEIQQIQVPELPVWRQELTAESKADWKVALKQARKALDEWKTTLKDGPHELDPRPVFLLDSQARPFRLELRLKANSDLPPWGWYPQGGYPATRLLMAGLEQVNAKQIRRLQAMLPPNYGAGSTCLVVQLTETGAGVCQLIVPAIWR